VPWRFLDAGQLSLRSLLVAGVQKPSHIQTHAPRKVVGTIDVLKEIKHCFADA
jgi:hypothetical protein